jgi:hypothetical protein
MGWGIVIETEAMTGLAVASISVIAAIGLVPVDGAANSQRKE